MNGLAMIFFTYLWPKSVEDTQEVCQAFANVPLNIGGIGSVNCCALKGFPIIGVYPYSQLPTHGPDNDLEPNAELVKSMYDHICREHQDDFQDVFLALHDQHFGAPCVEEDITDDHRYGFIDAILKTNRTIRKAILFRHEREAEIFESCLLPHLGDGWNKLDVNEFYKAILGYISRRPNLDAICRTRAEIMTPFIPLHLFLQLDEAQRGQEDWGAILEQAHRAKISVFTGKKLDGFLRLCGRNEEQIRDTITACSSYNLLREGTPWRVENLAGLKDTEKTELSDTIKRFADFLETIIEAV